MPWLSALAFAALHERAARAEAASSVAERRAELADARFDALFREYAALRQRGDAPNGGPGSPAPAAPAFPDEVHAELQEFIGDQDLYDHLRRYAEAELKRGTEPTLVAQAIRFGQNVPERQETE